MRNLTNLLTISPSSQDTLTFGGPSDLWGQSSIAFSEFEQKSVSMYFSLGIAQAAYVWSVSIKIYLDVYMSVLNIYPTMGYFPNGRTFYTPGHFFALQL